MRLLAVEIRRLTSRRLALLAALGVLGIIAIILVALFQSARPLSESELETAREQYEADLQYWEDGGQEECEKDEELAQESDPSIDYGCDQAMTFENYYWQEPTFAESAPALLPLLAIPIAFAAFVVAVSFVAAEFTTGSMGNWLTFEPRRTRVYVSKIGAAAVAALPFALLACALAIGGAYAVHAVNDHVGDMTSDVWADVAVSGLRVTLLTVGLAMLGAALGVLVRSTAAAIGIVIGYLIVVEAILGSLFAGIQPYLLRLNVSAVASGEGRYFVEECRAEDGGQVCDYIEKTVSLTHGAVTMTALLVVAVVLGWSVFRRRDVA